MDTFLITGVTGFLGRALAKRLLESNCKVIGIGRSDSQLKINDLCNNEHFLYLQGDISASLLNGLNTSKIKGVFHLASQQPSSKDLTYSDYYKGNVSTTTCLIEYFKTRPLDFFVYTSTISVFGKNKNEVIDEASIPEPVNYYSLTKYISEKLLEIESAAWPTKVSVIRLQSIFGKSDGYGIVHSFYHQMKKNEEVELYSKGNIQRNLLIIEDAVEILYSIIDSHKDFDKFEIFQAASANSMKTYDIAVCVKEYLQSTSNIICSDKKYAFDWDVLVNISKAKTKLGFQPRLLSDAILYYIKQAENEL